MLVVKTYIAHSKIPGAGLGLFVSENISKGQEVAVSMPGTYDIFTDEEYEKANHNFQNFISDFGCYQGGVWILEKDNEKFINHSRSPNLDPDGIAKKDILSGEELTYDYRQIDEMSHINPPPWL